LDFGWVSAPAPAEGAHGAPPDLCSWILGGPKGKGEGREEEGRGKG